MKKRGFTLAEVLITLGIIGVVAAMTIPTLITNYQTTANITSLRKAISILNNGVKLMMADEGIYSYSGLGFNSCPNVGTISTTEEDRACINSYFSKYFKIISYGKSQNDGLYPYVDILLHNGSNGRLVGALNLGVYYNFTTQDGMTFWPSCFNWPAAVDVNGPKSPNKVGYDIWVLDRNDNGYFSPYGVDTWNDESNNNDYCGDNGVGNGYGCTARVMAEGWKINY